MLQDTNIRSRILRRVQRVPSSRLKELDEFVAKLTYPGAKPERVLSFAGCWNDFEDDALFDFTDNLIANRQRGKRRFDG